jgi:hypothetical protein
MTNCRIWIAGVAGALILSGAARAQQKVVSQDTLQTSQEPTEAPMDSAAPAGHPADGLRHGAPPERFAVVPGTKFLVKLERDLNTKDLHRNQAFRVRTLEPLEAGSGIFLPSGAVILGHVSRVESAGMAGRAKVWLTFDEIQTRFGTLPIVAEVAAVPGDHSLRTGGVVEGVIQGKAGTEKDAAQAAAYGAAKGAFKGVKDKDKKEAAEGALMGALEAYLMEAGRGEELDLPQGSKLELELERSLYLLKE